MKRINIARMMENNGINIDRWEMMGMEFIRLNDGNYMLKDSNGYIVNEKEKLQLENKQLVLEDIKSNGCQGKITKKIVKNKKKIEKLDDETIEETKPAKK